MEFAVINTRVLVRGAANVLRRGEAVPDSLKVAVFDLARAVRALATYLEESEGPEPARRCALAAARGATGETYGHTRPHHERPRGPGPLDGRGPLEEHRHEPGPGPRRARGCRAPRVVRAVSRTD